MLPNTDANCLTSTNVGQAVNPSHIANAASYVLLTDIQGSGAGSFATNTSQYDAAITALKAAIPGLQYGIYTSAYYVADQTDLEGSGGQRYPHARQFRDAMSGVNTADVGTGGSNDFYTAYTIVDGDYGQYINVLRPVVRSEMLRLIKANTASVSGPSWVYLDNLSTLTKATNKWIPDSVQIEWIEDIRGKCREGGKMLIGNMSPEWGADLNEYAAGYGRAADGYTVEGAFGTVFTTPSLQASALDWCQKLLSGGAGLIFLRESTTVSYNYPTITVDDRFIQEKNRRRVLAAVACMLRTPGSHVSAYNPYFLEPPDWRTWPGDFGERTSEPAIVGNTLRCSFRNYDVVADFANVRVDVTRRVGSTSGQVERRLKYAIGRRATKEVYTHLQGRFRKPATEVESIADESRINLSGTSGTSSSVRLTSAEDVLDVAETKVNELLGSLRTAGVVA